ncbi:hypothetical protein Peur_042374 [Populus x canadensis]
MHQEAIDVTIQGMTQCIFVHYPGNSNHHIPIILLTLGDLFRFMLELIKTHLPAENCIDSYNMEPTLYVSRQDVRGAAGAYIDDTGLLDLELKSLGNHVAGNYLVRRCLNPVTKNIDREETGKMTLYCTVVLRNKQETTEVMNKAMPSFECITLKNNATFNYTGVNRRDVDCACGAKEDDGERMVSCGICEDRQHSRCVRIQNNQEMPPLFLCSCCENEIIILSSIP